MSITKEQSLERLIERLSPVQMRGLRELMAVHEDGYSWVRPQWLSGTPEERSSTNFRGLMNLGLVEGRKANPSMKQGQWQWRITEAGSALLSSLKEHSNDQ